MVFYYLSVIYVMARVGWADLTYLSRGSKKAVWNSTGWPGADTVGSWGY